MAAPIREAVWLIRHGFPPDLAFALDDLWRAAICIIVSEQEGNVFNWSKMDFEDPK